MKIINVQKNKHLTATEKRHIKALFGAGLLEGTINRKEYFIEQLKDNDYKVTIMEKVKSDFGFAAEFRKYQVTFSIKK